MLDRASAELDGRFDLRCLEVGVHRDTPPAGSRLLYRGRHDLARDLNAPVGSGGHDLDLIDACGAQRVDDRSRLLHVDEPDAVPRAGSMAEGHREHGPADQQVAAVEVRLARDPPRRQQRREVAAEIAHGGDPRARSFPQGADRRGYREAGEGFAGGRERHDVNVRVDEPR